MVEALGIQRHQWPKAQHNQNMRILHSASKAHTGGFIHRRLKNATQTCYDPLKGLLSRAPKKKELQKSCVAGSTEVIWPWGPKTTAIIRCTSLQLFGSFEKTGGTCYGPPIFYMYIYIYVYICIHIPHMSQGQASF